MLYEMLRAFINKNIAPVSCYRHQKRKFEQVDKIETVINKYASSLGNLENSTTLDLGCGPIIKNPFKAKESYGIDINTYNNNKIIKHDLNIEKIKFADRKFNFVTAYDFIEHVPRVQCFQSTRFPFIELMSEIYRVLEDGGWFLSYTPAYPSKVAFQDPTHVNIITEDTFPEYFCGPDAFAKVYGFNGNFELIVQVWHTSHLLTILKKI